MKKIFALLLAAMMLLSVMNALAEDESKEIKWQDIPWGCSISETIELLKQKYGKNITWSIDTWDSFSNQSEVSRVLPRNWYGLKVTVTLPNLRVAGFSVYSFKKKFDYEYSKSGAVIGNGYTAEYSADNNVELYFIPMLSEDKTSYSMNEGKLWAAAYVGLKPLTNIKEMETELSAKITTIYNIFPKDEDHILLNSGKKKKIWTGNHDEIRLVTFYEEHYSRISESSSARSLATSLIYSDFSLENEYSIISDLKQKEANSKKEQEEKQRQQEQDARGTDGL